MEEFDLCDIFRLQHPNTHRYTWRNMVKGGLVQSRLDMFFVSKNMQFQQIKSYIRTSTLSDHSLIQISFFLDNEWIRGRGFYKFNIKLLEDKTYVDAMNQKLDSLFSLREDFTDKSVLWDFVKIKISFSISYSSFKAKESRYKEQKIVN